MKFKWDEVKRNMERSFKTNWKLFKQSKLGLVGLGIIIFFLIIAIFAPIIPFTYTPNYLAPAGDLYELDNYTVSIPMKSNWHHPVSIQTPIMRGKPPRIAGIMIYDDVGNAYFYPRDFKYSQLLRLENPVKKRIPTGVLDMMYLPRNKMVFSITNKSVYLYPVMFERDHKTVDTNSFLTSRRSFHMNDTIFSYSNLWDYNLTDPTTGSVDGIVGFSTVSGKTVSLIVNVYQEMNQYGFKVKHTGFYTYNFTVNDTIVARPLIRLNFESNETWVIVTTENSIEKYNINFKVNETNGFIEGITGVSKNWTFDLNQPSGKYVLENKKSDALVYESATSQVISNLDIYVGICKNNFGFGIYVKNGTQAWNGTISLNPQDARIHSLTIKGIKPTVREFIMLYGETNVGGFVAKLDPKTGKVMASPVGNQTAYMVLKGDVNYVSQFDQGALCYYVSTKEGAIYQINELFYTNISGGARPVGLNKSFTVLGGAATPAVYLGNVLGVNQVGTYIGVVTKDNNLYFQASGGSRIPTVVIPPFGHGRYSGNFYLFGTDYEGHDIWTWLVYGSRTSLLVGLTAAIISVLAGTFIGIISGFYGGWIDIIIMRTVDIILTLPGIVIMLLLAAVLGPNIWNIVLIIAVLGWAGISRVIRAVTMSLKNRPFMDAARVAGASNARMITVHIFPNVLPLTFLYMTFGVAGAILSEAALAFLGLGDPNSVSWGMMLQFLRMYGQQTNPNAWGWLIMPGVFITLISLAFYLVGRAFDEIVNPRLRKR